MKTLGKILLLLVLLLCLLAATKDTLIEWIAKRAVKKSTGFELELASLHTSLLKQSFDINGVKLRNPPDFPEPDAFDINQLLVRYDLPSFFTATTRLNQVIIDIPRVVLVRKTDGESNLERVKEQISELSGAPEKGEGGEAPESPAPEPAPNPPTTPVPHEGKEKGFFIGELTVRLGKAEIHDYARGADGKPKVTTYDVNVNRTFTNVSNLQVAVSQVVDQVLIEGSLRAVSEQLEKSASSGKLNKTFEKIGRSLQGLFKPAQQSP